MARVVLVWLRDLFADAAMLCAYHVDRLEKHEQRGRLHA